MTYWQPDLFYYPDTASSRPLLGCSACLLGEPVRYDGGHKLQVDYATALQPFLELQSVCPEVGIGLGVPRPTLKVIDGPEGVRVVGVNESDLDVTIRLQQYAAGFVERCDQHWPLTGWILKARSPSCGIHSTPVNPDTPEERPGSGAFAAGIRDGAGWLPLFEEESLLDTGGREHLLLMSYICQDILWQGDMPATALCRHYSERLGCRVDAIGNRKLHIWQAVQTALGSLLKEERRELVNEYRTA